MLEDCLRNYGLALRQDGLLLSTRRRPNLGQELFQIRQQSFGAFQRGEMTATTVLLEKTKFPVVSAQDLGIGAISLGNQESPKGLSIYQRGFSCAPIRPG